MIRAPLNENTHVKAINFVKVNIYPPRSVIVFSRI